MKSKMKKTISRAKNKRFIFTCKPHLSDRGYNQAVEVYEVKPNSVDLVATDYKINTASCRGPMGDAVQALAAVYTDLKHDGYRITDSRVAMMEEVVL
jgi:hypothetical protein